LKDALAFEFEREGVPVQVRVALRANQDPAATGCPDFARGFPVMEATIEPPARGYQDLLGWIQLIDAPHDFGEQPRLDSLEMLSEVSHPFGYFGHAPTAFDAPHRDNYPDMDWVSHTFLAGIAGIHLPFEARAILGFRWGYSIRDGEVSIIGLSALDASAWDAFLPFLHEKCPAWTFAPHFEGGRLR